MFMKFITMRFIVISHYGMIITAISWITETVFLVYAPKMLRLLQHSNHDFNEFFPGYHCMVKKALDIGAHIAEDPGQAVGTVLELLGARYPTIV